MLNCKLCDYYTSLAGNPGANPHAAKCSFSDVLFFEDVETLDMEYPCRRLNYADYLARQAEPIASEVRLVNEDWRYLYRKDHPKEATDRLLRHAI